MKPLHLIAMTDKPPVFLPVSEDRLTQEALMHILRSYSDAVERLATSGERRDAQHAEILKMMASIDKRLSLVEAGTLKQTVEDIDRRLKMVEADQQRRQGREGVWSAFWRSPFAAWLTAAGVIISGVFTWLKGGAGQ